jgi:hypothetical protein
MGRLYGTLSVLNDMKNCAEEVKAATLMKVFAIG